MPSTTLGETLGGPSLSRSLLAPQTIAADEGRVREGKAVSDGKRMGGGGLGWREEENERLGGVKGQERGIKGGGVMRERGKCGA